MLIYLFHLFFKEFVFYFTSGHVEKKIFNLHPFLKFNYRTKRSNARRILVEINGKKYKVGKQNVSTGICTLSRKMTSFRQSENVIVL